MTVERVFISICIFAVICFIIGNIFIEKNDVITKKVISFKKEQGIDKRRIHVFYVHYLDTNDQKTEENFKFFMNFAYSPCNPAIFYSVILNRVDTRANIAQILNKLLGKQLMQTLIRCFVRSNETVTKDFYHNTRLIVRKNKPGGDLCAFVELLNNSYWFQMEHLFSYFFLINSSVRGPFLPNYYLKGWQVFFFCFLRLYY